MPLGNWFKSKERLEKEKINRYKKEGKKLHRIQTNNRYDPGHNEWYTNDEWARHQAEEFKILANRNAAQAEIAELYRLKEELKRTEAAEKKAEELQRCRTIVAEANSQRGGRKTRRNRKSRRV